jgi:hypothetical protein
MKTFLIEAHVGRVERIDFHQLVARADRSASAVSGSGAGVHVLRTILLPDDETCLCLVEADELGSVRFVADAARLRPQRIIEVVTEGSRSAEARS